MDGSILRNKIKLSPKAKAWVKNALLNSDAKSLKVLRKQTHSLACDKKMKEELQFGQWEGYRILDFAVRHGHDILFDLLVEELNVDPNLPAAISGVSALHHCAATGQLGMIKKLVEKFVCDIEAKDFGKSTPLCSAIACAQNESLRMLLRYGASAEVETFMGMPNFLAIYSENVDAVRILHEASPHVVNSEIYGFCTPLVAASFYHSTECFEYLAEAANVNAKHLLYKVICCSGSEQCSKERIDILLKHGVSPNFFDENLLEELPIICAAKKGWRDMVEMLLIHTDPRPGTEWSVGGVIEYVNSERFLEMNSKERLSRVKVLKERMLSELYSQNYLAADLICKSLFVDLDQEEWDWYQSLCKLLIWFGLKSTFLECNIETLQYVGMTMIIDKDNENVLLAVKACIALDPDNKSCKDFLAHVEGMDSGASASSSARDRGASASSSGRI